jgi:ATP-binding cassette subfamily F protein 3
MSLLTGNNLAKEFGPDEIFSGVNIDIPHKARIALVGPNGAGKTTLLNLLIGAELPSAGKVSKAKGLRIGFLPQRPELHGHHRLWDELLTAFDDLRRMEADLARLEQALTNADDALLRKYGELQHRFEEAGGYTYDIRMKMVLQGLSFTPDEYDRPLSKLSGGQKTRALLGRLLLEAPDLLVLDEPTNHLDIEAVEWLEHFLKDFPGAVLVVSHDRYFLDAVASNVWELDFGTLETYRGNYSHYAQQREERHERLLKEYEAQQEFIAKEEEYIRRNIAGQNTRQAQGRRTRLERLKRDKLIHRPRNRQNVRIRLGDTMRSGDKVLMTNNLAVGYADADEPLFYAPDITLYRGEVAALIGPNGAGKSTFLKTILGELEPLSGETKLGAAVKVGYFAQAHELLNPRNSILDEILSVKHMQTSQARNYLAQYLFQEDDVFRPIETLSGGERGRVALAKLALLGANFLLLDEPTNHLDIASQEILESVLDDFAGTILLVSHDRYLIDALATQIWAVSPGKLDVFKGTYKEYVAARSADETQVPAPSPTSKGREQNRTNGMPLSTGGEGQGVRSKQGLNARQHQQRVAEVEQRIHELETQVADLTEAITQASAEGNAARVRDLGEAYAQAEADLHAALAEWESLME